MTACQAGSGRTVEHVALGNLALWFFWPQLIYFSPEEPPNPRKCKWTEVELAQRREEAARKRKLKGAQKQEDEKVGSC